MKRTENQKTYGYYKKAYNEYTKSMKFSVVKQGPGDHVI